METAPLNVLDLRYWINGEGNTTVDEAEAERWLAASADLRDGLRMAADDGREPTDRARDAHAELWAELLAVTVLRGGCCDHLKRVVAQPAMIVSDWGMAYCAECWDGGVKQRVLERFAEQGHLETKWEAGLCDLCRFHVGTDALHHSITTCFWFVAPIRLCHECNDLFGETKVAGN